jgi:hypothetical protein
MQTMNGKEFNRARKILCAVKSPIGLGLTAPSVEFDCYITTIQRNVVN